MQPTSTFAESVAWIVMLLGSQICIGAVTVEKTDYHGWKDSWKVSNGTCELVIVPQVNRMMSFSLVGSPSPIWNNDAIAGQVQLSDDNQWHNFGGDKVWPTQQDWWQRYSD